MADRSKTRPNSEPTGERDAAVVLARYHEGVLAGLVQEMQKLRAEVDELREEVASDELSARRLVVVNEHGHESIVLEAKDNVASVKLVCQDDPEVWMQIEASDEGGPTAGVYLSGGGNGVGMFDVFKEEHDLGTTKEAVWYAARLDIIEERGSRITVNHEGVSFNY